MTTEDQIAKLAERLHVISEPTHWVLPAYTKDMAEGILLHTQELIDTLVEVGVLIVHPETHRVAYTVVQPHVHDWQRIGAWLDCVDGPVWVRKECKSCKETTAEIVLEPL